MGSPRSIVIGLLSVVAASQWLGGADAAGKQSASASAAPSDRTRYVQDAIAGPGLPAEVNGRRLTGLGTGFFISSTRMITNHHVAGRCAIVTGRIGEQRKTAVVSVVATDPEHDLALLAGDEGSGRAAPFAREPSGKPGAYSVVGYPEHGLPTVRPSLVEVSIDSGAVDPATGLIAFRGTVRRGNSGGPLLDGSGAVVGIVARKLNAPAVYQMTGKMPEDVGFAVPLRVVADFLRRNDTPVTVAPDAAALDPDQLLEKARNFIAQIGCWN